MRKLFISYRSSDAAKVDKIAVDLNLLRNDDGTARYITWQDKHNLPPASPNWWDAIVDAISDSDLFVFNISNASLQSEVCRAELEYAHKLNLPIIPIVLSGEFYLDQKSGKYDLPKQTWEIVPDWLGKRQFLFYVGADFFEEFVEAVALFENRQSRRVNVARPLNPNSKSVHASNHEVYETACDYAERLAFDDAERHFYELIERNDADYADVAEQWLEIIHLYNELIEIDKRRKSRLVTFRDRWSTYIGLFPKNFLESIFDPKDFATQYPNKINEGTQADKNNPKITPSVSVQKPILILPQNLHAKYVNPLKPVRDISLFSYLNHDIFGGAGHFTPIDAILPDPFMWVEIIGKDYNIAKYPITNEQFTLFIKADGYNQKKWWTDLGWYLRKKEGWTHPFYWNEHEWNGKKQPVVGVSWYEAVAFCLWMSEAINKSVMLPTERQWQYAAQGTDGRNYPWGNNWDARRCNNRVNGIGMGSTTPVRHYEGKGDSPYGVVDMAGNVYEWCLTDYDSQDDDINSNAKLRAVRGGACNHALSDYFRCDHRGWSRPERRSYDYGFRISCS